MNVALKNNPELQYEKTMGILLQATKARLEHGVWVHTWSHIERMGKMVNWQPSVKHKIQHQWFTIIFSTVCLVSGSRSDSLLDSGSTFWVSISGSPFTIDFHHSILSCLVKRIETALWSSAKWQIYWYIHNEQLRNFIDGSWQKKTARTSHTQTVYRHSQMHTCKQFTHNW